MNLTMLLEMVGAMILGRRAWKYAQQVRATVMPSAVESRMTRPRVLAVFIRRPSTAMI